MLLKFTTDCPQCGGKKKLKTKVDLLGKVISKAKCYTCGYHLPAEKL